MTKNRKKLFASIAIVIIIMSFVAVSKIRSSQQNRPKIETAKVEIGTVMTTVSASGILQPLTTVDVKSNAGGLVDMLAVDVGDIVKPGQLIAKIDPTDTRTALNQAAADLSAADARLEQSKEAMTLQQEQSKVQITQAEQAIRASKARLAQAEAQSKVQPALTQAAIKQAQAGYDSANATLRQLREAGKPLGIAQAKTSYDQANATLEKTNRNLNRQKDLYAKGYISGGALDAAQLEYDTAKAQADTAKQRQNTAELDFDSQLTAAQARLDQAQAALENAKVNAVQDSIRKQELEAARAAVKQSEADLESAKSNKRQVPIRAADIRTSQAQIVRTQAQVDNAQTQLNYTTITAPRGGVILQKYVEVGTIITSGRSSFSGTGSGTSIVQLGDVSRMFVLAQVDESDIAEVRVGQPVSISLDAYANQRFRGKVTRIDPQTVVVQNVTTIPVTVEISRPDRRLKPGMNATCDFIIDQKRDVLSVPSEAVKDEGDDKFTVSVMKDGKPVDVPVKVGLIGDDNTEIISGLKEGDEVVTAIIEGQGQGAGGAGGPGGGSRPGGGGGQRPGSPLGGGGHFH